MDRDWQAAFSKRLERVALDEYRMQRAAHLKAGRRKSTFRYNPPDWQRDAVAALGRNDEEAAKAALMYRLGK